MRYIIVAFTSIIFVVTSSTIRPSIHTLCPGRQDSLVPSTSYYNLSGVLVKEATQPVKEIRIVLSRSSSIELVDSFIKIGYTIKVPTVEILDSLDSCSRRADRLGYEHGFVIGKKDKVSIIIKGARRSFSTLNRKAYFNNLTMHKKDIPACDVHAHPRSLFTTKEGVVYGNAQASPEDMTSYDIKEFNHNWKYNQPSIVLGYEPDPSTLREVGNYKLIRYIGFYNYCNSRIDTMQIDTFRAHVLTILKITPTTD